MTGDEGDRPPRRVLEDERDRVPRIANYLRDPYRARSRERRRARKGDLDPLDVVLARDRPPDAA